MVVLYNQYNANKVFNTNNDDVIIIKKIETSNINIDPNQNSNIKLKWILYNHYLTNKQILNYQQEYKELTLRTSSLI